MEYVNLLEKLRLKLGNGQMSVMIGSGFSKNVSPLFPTWDELLRDLLNVQFGSMLSREYRQLPALRRKSLSEKTYFLERCAEILKEKGYLQVVSDYIKSHSVEGITTYIEERTPYVEIKDGKIALTLGAVEQSLPFEDLDLHRSLVGLGWNNIYTTNYDQLLDICVSEQLPSELKKDILLFEKELSELNSRYDDNERRERDLAVEIGEYENISQVQAETALTTPTLEHLRVLKNEQKEVNQELYAIRRQARLKKAQLEKKERLLSECFTIVTDASRLQVKRNKNIIKLHGSLRTPAERSEFKFGFDGNHKNQYIIAQEDYDNYPRLHEPFTQLMRISLLQEAFCLIGFSANDPNFLAWIGWVRDILQRDNVHAQGKEVKIFLIDTSDEEISADRLLFFENHNIKRIPLKHSSLDELLGKFNRIEKGFQTRKDYLNGFISYLLDDENSEPMIPLSDTTHLAEWQDIWKDRTSLTGEPRQDILKIKNNLSRLKKLPARMYIPDLRYTDTQLSLVRFYDNFPARNLRQISRPVRAKMTDEEEELLGFAIQDLMLPVDYCLSEEHTKVLHARADKIPGLQESLGLSCALHGDHKTIYSTAQEVYALAFGFKFKALKKRLQGWNPKGIEVLQKAGLLGLVNSDEAQAYIAAMLSPQSELDAELRLYLTEIDMGGGRQDWKGRKKLQAIVDAYSKQGFTSLADNFKYLSRIYEPGGNKLETLGSGRYSVSRTDNEWNEARDKERSLKYLMLMMRSGTQLNHGVSVQLSGKDWFEILGCGFEIYPEAFLFYSLQFGERDYCKRIGQEYANSLDIPETIKNKIAGNLFAALDTAPEQIRDAIIAFLSTFITAVDPAVWQNKFMKVWRKAVHDRDVFKESYLNAFAKLVYPAVHYMENVVFLFELVGDFLAADQMDRDNVQLNYTYHLQLNFYFSRISRRDFDFSTVDNLIGVNTGGISERQLEPLYMLGNLRRLLKPEQKDLIREKVAAMDFSQIADSRFWSVALYFGDGDQVIVNKLKSVVLKNKSLWDTGYLKKEGDRNSWTYSDPIILERLSKSESRYWGIEWSKAEINVLAKVLLSKKEEFDLIMRYPERLFDYESLSEQMNWFVRTYKEALQNQKYAAGIFKLTETFYRYNTHFEQVEDGLMSLNKADVNWALGDIAARFNHDEVDEEQMVMVLNKVLFQAEPAVEACLGYLIYWVEQEGYRNNSFWGARGLILNVLRKYRFHPLEGTDRSFSDYHLCRIALALQKAKVSDPDLQWWLDRAKSSPFNSIKQLLKRDSNGVEMD